MGNKNQNWNTGIPGGSLRPIFPEIRVGPGVLPQSPGPTAFSGSFQCRLNSTLTGQATASENRVPDNRPQGGTQSKPGWNGDVVGVKSPEAWVTSGNLIHPRGPACGHGQDPVLHLLTNTAFTRLTSGPRGLPPSEPPQRFSHSFYRKARVFLKHMLIRIFETLSPDVAAGYAFSP